MRFIQEISLVDIFMSLTQKTTATSHIELQLDLKSHYSATC